MPIPNTITRTLDLSQPPDAVWAALTTIEGLTGWFGSHAEGEIRPGEQVRMRWAEYDNAEQVLTIQVVDPKTVFAYSWAINGAPEGDPRRTYVEFRLEPTAGGTRLTLSESGFAQLPDEWLASTYEGNTAGWRAELDELVSYLDAA